MTNGGTPAPNVRAACEPFEPKATAPAPDHPSIDAGDRFRTLFQQAPFSVQLLARDGRTLAVNDAWERLWQASDALKAYVLGEYDMLADPQLVATGVTEQLRRAFDGESVELPTIVYDPARLGRPGRPRLVRAYAHPVRGDDGVVAEVMLIHEDITEREAATERLALATQAGGIGIWEWDIACDAMIWSDEVYPLHGLARGDFGGRMADFAALVHPEDRASVSSRIDEALSGENAYTAEFRAVLPDGRTRWLSTWARVRRDTEGRAVHMVGATIDIDQYRSTEAALRHSETRLRLAAQAVGLGFFDYDPQRDEGWWSPEMRALFGVAPDGPVRRDELIARIHPEDRALHAAEFARALDPDRGGHYQCEYRVLLDGTVRWIRIEAGVAFGVSATDANALRVIGVAVNITEQRRAMERLRESQERFRLIDESSALGTLDTDLVAGTVRFSTAASRMLDLEGEVLPRDAPYERVHPADLERLRAHVANAIASGEERDFRDQVRIVHRDGTVRWIELLAHSRLGTDDQGRQRVLRFWGVVWDVTEQVRVIEILREGDRRKDEFLAMLAHELRNPLAPITNALALLERSEPLTGRGRQALGLAQRQTRQMQRLVDDLLEVSRITRGKIELRCEALSVQAAVHAAVEAQLSGIEERRQTVSVALPERPIRIVADPARISQVLDNLLANARKFTPEGGAIRVEVEALADAVELRVIDSGIGIAPEKIGQLFELFQQLDVTLDRAQGGLGIGLALVKRLVELHGGSVRADSAGVGQGSTFAVRLPLRSSDGA